jgi:hypothetical protein
MEELVMKEMLEVPLLLTFAMPLSGDMEVVPMKVAILLALVEFVPAVCVSALVLTEVLLAT